MGTVRLAMVGAGRHAVKNVYPCFSLLKGAAVLANCDLDTDRAEKAARAFGIARHYTDYREMLSAEKPDGVVVCIGPDMHARLAMELMETGYHVYTEKPPALNADQCRKVVRVQKETGRICMTAFKKRFAPAYVKARALVEDPRFNDPALLSMLRTSGPYGDTDDPRSQYILESGIHAVDLAAYLFGPIARVAVAKKPSASFAVILEYANGAVGTLALCDRMSYDRAFEQVSLIGSGQVCVQVDNSVEMLAFHKGVPIAAHKPEFGAGSSHSSVEMGFVGELQAFADAIRGGHMPEAGIASSCHSMAVIEAIQKAAGTDSFVDVKREPI